MAKQKSKTWVCTICSQSFTRNSSAKRHDINLHGGNGEYVRYVDYEIGRVQGKYYQNDPAFFKKYSYNYGNPNVNKPTPNFGSESTQSYIPNNEIDSYNYVNSNSFTPLNYDEPARKTSILDKAEEIIEIVDQINNLAKDVLKEYQIKHFTRWLLIPYYTNNPHPKAVVEKNLNAFKKNIAITRLKNLFRS